MFAVLGQILRRLLASVHAGCGWVAFRTGGCERARRHYERVLQLGGDEFAAFVHLGRIALRDGDCAGYRREMANARAADPERFARLRPVVDGFSLRLPAENPGERATWRSVRSNGSFVRRSAAAHQAELPLDGLPADGVEELLQRIRAEALAGRARGDDFASADERERFRRAAPIRTEDVRAADLDDLARRLGS